MPLGRLASLYTSRTIDFLLHVDERLVAIVEAAGPWSYAVLFAIIFAETGFVVTPFLPGDSLLFAAGALAATGCSTSVSWCRR